MLHLSLAVAVSLLCAPGDDSKKAVEDFKAKMKDARSVQEKALAIRVFGSTSDGTGALNLQEILKVQNRQPGT